MKATDIMIKEFNTILPSTTVKEAVTLFKRGWRGEGRTGVDALIVVDEAGKLTGIITMSHILKAVIPFYMEMAHLAEFAWEGLFERMCHRVQDKHVSELMNRNVITIAPDTNLIEVASIMAKKEIRRVPVVEHGTVVGVVYRKELFFKIVETMLEKEDCK